MDSCLKKGACTTYGAWPGLVWLGQFVIPGKLYIPVTNELTIVRLIGLLYSGTTVDYRLRYFKFADVSKE